MKHYSSLWFLLFALFQFGDCIANEIQVEQIYSADEINLFDLPLATMGNYGLFCASGNKILSLEDSNNLTLSSIEISDSIQIDNFFFIGDKLLLKHKESVIWSDSKGNFDGISFEDSRFNICSGTDSTFFIIRPKEHIVLEISIETKMPIYSYNINEIPILVGKFGNSTLLVCNNSIYINYDNETRLLHKHLVDIKTAAITPLGIYFGTDEALWRIISTDELELVANGSVNKIIGAGRTLYVLDGTGSLFKIFLTPKDE